MKNKNEKSNKEDKQRTQGFTWFGQNRPTSTGGGFESFFTIMEKETRE